MTIRYPALFALLSVCGILFGACSESEAPITSADRIIGVKIYENDGPLTPIFEKWQALGINAVFASENLNFSTEFRRLARAKGIRRFLITPVFYDPEALEKDPDLYAVTDRGDKAVDEWVAFVCPSRDDFRNRKAASIGRLVKECDPDGLSIDFIRHFVFWERVFPDRSADSLANTCFCPYCLEKFRADTKIIFPPSLDSPSEAADWIEEHHAQAWTDWKCGLITGMVDRIVDEARRLKPGILINIHTVPWRQDDFDGAIKTIAGQDLQALAPHADYLSPMTYSHMVRRPPPWIHSVVLDVAETCTTPILPSIQVSKAYLETELTDVAFRQSLEEALRPPSSGVVFWNWAALDGSPSKKAVLQDMLASGRKDN